MIKLGMQRAVQRLLLVGKAGDAVKLYESNPDPYSATSLISHTYRNLNNLSLCFSIYKTLKQTQGIQPDNFVYTALLNACQKLGGGCHIPFLWKDILQYRLFWPISYD